MKWKGETYGDGRAEVAGLYKLKYKLIEMINKIRGEKVRAER